MIAARELVYKPYPDEWRVNLLRYYKHEPTDIVLEQSTRGQRFEHPVVGSKVSYSRRASGRKYGRIQDVSDYYLKRRLDIRSYMGERNAEAFEGVLNYEHQRDVISWAEAGEGILVGVTKRWIGKGEYGSYRGGYYDEPPEFEWSFSPKGTVALYEVKKSLGGPKILVPVRALEVIDNEAS